MNTIPAVDNDLIRKDKAVLSGGLKSEILEVRNLEISFNSPPRSIVMAVQQVSFNLEPGHRLMLLGKSGCGKTTILNAIAGYIQPTQGDIRVGKVAISGPCSKRFPVFQETDQLFPWKTVLENVVFAIKCIDSKRRSEAIDIARHWLEKVGLGAFERTYPSRLSGGMRQRVALARAFAVQPEIMLLDEPFAALDALTRRSMQEELLSLWRHEPLSMIMVTHSIQEALTLGDSIIVLSDRPAHILATIPAPSSTRERAEVEREIERLLGLHTRRPDHSSGGVENLMQGQIR